MEVVRPAAAAEPAAPGGAAAAEKTREEVHAGALAELVALSGRPDRDTCFPHLPLEDLLEILDVMRKP